MKNILSLVVVFFLLTSISWGDMGDSREGATAEVTLTHTSALDSAWVIFTCNGERYDSIKVTPTFGSSSRFLGASGLDLDSLCSHAVEIRMYSSDTWSDTLTGGWLHENPNLTTADEVPADMVKISGDATAANNAELFFDGTGYAGTGNTIPTVTTTTNLTTNNDKTGYKLAADGLDSDTSFTQVQGKTDKLIFDGDDSLIVEREGIAGAIWDEDTTGHYAPGKYGYEATSAGGGDKNTEAEITGWVKATLEDTTNTARDATKDDYKDGSGGVGTELCSLLVIDSDAQAVANMSWTVKDFADNDLAIAQTNTAGWVTFNLNQADSVALHPTERVGLAFTTSYSIAVPNNGFCDTLTGTIWNYAVGAAPLCNIYANLRDFFYQDTGYSDWTLDIVFGDGSNYLDTINNVPVGGYEAQVSVTDTGLVQQQVVVSCRALKYDRSTVPPTLVDSAYYSFIVKDGRNKTVLEAHKVYIPCDSTQYDLRAVLKP